MKRVFVWLALGMVVCSFVLAQDEPTVEGVLGSGSSEDVQKIQGAIDYIPINESGKVDYGKFKPFISKAEVRIEAINLWLDENAGWMRYIFHMKPSVSLLFFIEGYVLIWFFTLLFLNANGLWFFIESKRSRKVFGGFVFLAFMFVRLYYGVALVLNAWILYAWFVLVEAGIWIALIAGIIFVVGFWFGGKVFLKAIGGWLAKYQAKKERAREKMDIATSIESVEALAREISKKS